MSAASRPKIPIVEHVAGSMPALVIANVGGAVLAYWGAPLAATPIDRALLPAFRSGCLDAAILAAIVWLVQRGTRRWVIALAAVVAAGLSLLGGLVAWSIGSDPDPKTWELPGPSAFVTQALAYLEYDPLLVLDGLGVAVGFGFAARWRGRWFEGVAFAAPQSLLAIAHALATNKHDRPSMILEALGFLAAAALALPIARRGARAAFERIGLHVREEA